MTRHNTGAFVAPAVLGARNACLGAAAQCGRRTWSIAATPPRRARLEHHPAHDLNAPKPRAMPTANMPGNIDDIPIEPIPPRPLELPAYWARPGVYGVYATDGVLQYVAAANDVRLAIDGHRMNVGDEARVAMVRMMTVDDAASAPLDDVSTTWVITMEQIGQLPPGNSDAAPEWRIEPSVPTARDVKFAGSGLGAETEIKEILRNHNVVLFMKGTRDAPQCGFSNYVVGVLEETGGDEGFLCVNRLDEVKNPGLWQGIKEFSSWPIIPQLFINGDFVGGADIVGEMLANGELMAALAG